MKLKTLAFALILAALGSPLSRAEEAPKPAAEPAQASPQAAQQPAPAPAAQEPSSNRMKTLLGSKSRLSGQFNLTYNGSTLDHPFSNKMPNPGNQVPPPLATLSGTVALRYRTDSHTTLGLGTGIRTEQPFQGPKNTTLNNPYIDIVHSYRTGPIRHRVLGQIEYFTEHQYHEVFGYRFAFTAINESFHEFDFGLTTGVLFELDYFTFAEGNYPATAQVVYDYAMAPYVEYRISKRVNIRTVAGIVGNNMRKFDGMFKFQHPKIYQTLGLGIAVLDNFFIYPYVKAYPYSGNTHWNTAFIGFNAIVNIF